MCERFFVSVLALRQFGNLPRVYTPPLAQLQLSRYDALGNITDSGITIRALGSQHHCTPTQPSFGLQKLSGWKQ